MSVTIVASAETRDHQEGLAECAPTLKVPFSVMLVWACALLGLAAYSLDAYFPHLALWGGR